jgi:hypothetical protein
MPPRSATRNKDIFASDMNCHWLLVLEIGMIVQKASGGHGLTISMIEDILLPKSFKTDEMPPTI